MSDLDKRLEEALKKALPGDTEVTKYRRTVYIGYIKQAIEDAGYCDPADTASKIFNLAHEYAQADETMIGAEELRGYHYFNAIHTVGKFDGR
jgi:hypothetical protein